MVLLPDNQVLIGVDGGATEVKAHEVLVLGARPGLTLGLTLGLGTASAACCYDRARGFRPAPMARQLVALESGRIDPAPLEREQGDLWIDAAARSILAVAEQAGASAVRVAVCLPGIKTADGRGVAAIRHGPRMPDFLARLEERLVGRGLALATSIPPLVGDGDACGWGEEADARGLFRGVANAYYVGGGTGLAETIKLGGRVIGMDAMRGSLTKAWRMRSARGRDLEEVLSARGINATWAERAGLPLPVADEEFPERRAARGDAVADEVLREAAEALADLVLDRLLALRGPRAQADAEAPGFLDRVVVGQRLGRIFADPDLGSIFRERVEESLARRIDETQDVSLRARHLDGSALKPGFLAASTLRAAPALGAVAMALTSEARARADRRRAGGAHA